MNDHVNLGALRLTRPAGKVGAGPAPSTPPKSPAEEGVITAEFAVALPAVTVVLALCLGAASTGLPSSRWRNLRERPHEPQPAEIPRHRFAPAVSRIDPAQNVQISVSPDAVASDGAVAADAGAPGKCACG